MEKEIESKAVEAVQAPDQEAAQGLVEDGASASSSGPVVASLMAGLGGILGVKAGMTQIYGPEGQILGVTVIDLKPCVVTQVKRKADNGYAAIQVGFLHKKEKNVSKPEAGHLKASQAKGFHLYQEFRVPEDQGLDGMAAGQLLGVEFLREGDLVDLTAQSKGKGFQGGMKRYHMRGGPKSHGASVCHRSLGSIGNRADPSKCFKNKKMAGQMGNERVTVQSVKVVGIDWENRVLLVNGSIPGPKHGVVRIRRAIRTKK